jgi:hypothetical protein
MKDFVNPNFVLVSSASPMLMNLRSCRTILSFFISRHFYVIGVTLTFAIRCTFPIHGFNFCI